MHRLLLRGKPCISRLLNVEPKAISIRNYTYDLPDDRIARYPLPQRDEASLLVYKDSGILKGKFKDLKDFLPGNSCLVFNNSKVIHARVIFNREGASPIECFCLEPYGRQSPDEIFKSHTSVKWLCMVGNAKRWKEEVLTKSLNGKYGPCVLSARKTGESGRDRIVDFSWDNPSYSFSEVLEMGGVLPIPPYLNRPSEHDDEIRYNTVYAGMEGSVAAPTAGLHFTHELLAKLSTGGTQTLYLTLHVGAGTFRPVSGEYISDHEMHAERIAAGRDTIVQLSEACRKKVMVAVGTTSARTLESLYWLGVKLNREVQPGNTFFISQWEPYTTSLTEFPPAGEVFDKIVSWMDQHALTEITAYTQMMIAPGYSFRVLDALITNFHQPGSTLLLLVAALIGDDWKKVYDFALANNFRFLSYGDSSLLFSKQPR
ncbi:MAG: S-adenosylmethionine:tRNA ribosyltransferase-isomerase [Bacteroidia bacterium]|nr:S-adenosylmethionine:tRNA ribosyltransferase-isomerase [Bacteroidia bacterium]